jgi:2-polyprenyl-3-methyl-5-hydroxy-6-metoxy-1,4-benzoquinol methylase/GNAT superfamily N-acetyltransferase
MNNFNPQYKTIKCSSLSSDEINQCSDLFSNHYGKYSGKDKHSKGERIKLKTSFYERLKENENMYVSLCFNNEELLGHAFFLRKEISGKGYCSWITQLVVHSFYRKRGIGSKLLQSAWGFSNDYAWGVATTNSLTIKTLESVTYRDVNISDMKTNIEVIELLSDDIEFANKDYIIFNDKKSQIYTRFFPEIDIATSNKKEIQDIYTERLGEIMDGHEWLAFTFKTQPFVSLDKDKLQKLLVFSEQQLQEAYSRMDMPNQNWTKGTVPEVDYIIEKVGLAKGNVLDFGCGLGRHCIELSKRGYTVTGIDFSAALIKKASGQVSADNLQFIHDDCRKYLAQEKVDIILCLYDVIGSFREEKENLKIIGNIYANLKTGGKAVVSVMNMELTDFLVKYKTSISKNPEKLLKLEASNIMATSGNVFKPDYYLIDTDSNLVFRKEQFNQDGLLSTEYIVADKRYTKDEISGLFENVGFKIISAIYVQAGKWDIPLEATDNNAKEIVLIVEKI